MHFRGYTYRAYPTADQEIGLLNCASACRLVWNLALEQRSNHWRRYQERTGDNLNFITQSRELTELRAEFAFIRKVSQSAEQRVIKQLDDAFRMFFSGKGGYPKFKKKGFSEAFSFQAREVSLERLNKRWGRVRLPKIGWVKIRMHRDISGEMAEVTVSLTSLGWKISVGCKNVELPDSNAQGSVGVDRGVSVPLMLSDGTSYRLPVGVANAEAKARKAQRIASRGKRGSARNAKSKKRAASVRAKQARIRKDWAHKATTDICRNYKHVVIERLRTKDMTKAGAGKRGLNRSILNVGWHQIETMLFYKAGKVTKIDPRYTSQTCSSCGTVDKESRKSQAVFHCVHCGHKQNADHNAAINILNRGSTPGVEQAVAPVSKRVLLERETPAV